jgi:Flp pilus assembly protein TadD
VTSKISQRTDNQKVVFLFSLMLVLLGTVLYFRTLQAPFLFDDRISISENDIVKDFPKALATGSQNRYIGTLSFAVNYLITGAQVYGYHVTNVAIHIGNAFLVYLLVQLLVNSPALRPQKRSSNVAAFLAAFVFIAHPLHTQAVSYISQRFTSLATLFYLASVCCYIQARNLHAVTFEPKEQRQSSVKMLALYSLSVISAILAVKTKEIAATIPLMMITTEIFLFRGKKGRVPAYVVPVVLSIIFILIFTVPAGLMKRGQTIENMAAGMSYLSKETGLISRSDYFITQIRVIVSYLRLLLFPVNQNIDYVFPIYRSFVNPDIVLSLSSIGMLLGVGIRAWRKYPIIAFGIAWFFIALSVESSIIPIRDVMNEHRMYLPSIGLIFSCVLAVDSLFKSQGAKITLIGTVVLFFSLMTFTRNEVWRDPAKLWADAVSKSPYNMRAYNNLGTVYKERKEYDSAIKQFNSALQLNGSYMPALYNLGDVQYQLGNYTEALPYLKQATAHLNQTLLRIDALNKLGRTYGALKRYPEAIETLEKARKEFPSSVITLNNLGVQYMKNNEQDKAIDILQQALTIRKEPFLYSNLAVAYAMKGDRQKGEEMYWKAVDLQSLRPQ